MRALLCFLLLFVASASTFAATYTVDFEDASKGAYAPSNVTLNGISWNLNNALIGTTTSDKKNGAKSCRARHPFTNTMNAAKSGGIGTVSLLYARYGTDSGAPEMIVEYSTDDGATWTQAGSSFSANGVDNLSLFSATVNQPGDVRIRIISISGTTGMRANLDDIVVTDSGAIQDPVIAVSPSGNFGSVLTNTSTNIVFTIANNGANSNLIITTPLSINGSTTFTIAAQPLLSTIPPGSSTTFSVQFAPPAVTSYVGSIIISNNSAFPTYVLNLSGSGASGYAPPPAGFWYEPFDYPNGDLTNVSPHWLTVSGSGGLLVEDGTLLYPDYPVTGKKLVFGSGSLDARRNFTSTNVVYASFLMQVNALPTTTNDYVVSFNPPTYGTRFFLSGESATGSFRCGLSSAAGNLTWSSTEFPTGVVHRIVLKFDSIASNLNAWINPGPTETTPDVSVSPAGAANAVAFAIRQGANFDNSKSSIYFDEIIIGGSWNDVQIPEPSSLLLFLMPVILACRRSP